MTYKEKKLKKLKELFLKEEGAHSYIRAGTVEDFISSTIDEILGCLPEKQITTSGVWLTRYKGGFNSCRDEFLQNLEEKAGEL